MHAQQLFEQGRLDEAVERLLGELRDDPADARRRAFLFELLVFRGDLERAARQLEVFKGQGPNAERGALFLRGILQAELERQTMWAEGALPAPLAEVAWPGTVNGRPAAAITDADERLGPRLEVILAGRYTWMPYAHIRSLVLEPPETLRDTIWARGTLRAGDALGNTELGDVLVPLVAPLSWRHPDGAVRLGRTTDMLLDERTGEEVPVGAKLLRVDDDWVPLIEVRSLEFAGDAEPAEG